MTMFYLDISSHNRGIDLSGWNAVAIKVTEGTYYVNPYFQEQVAEAKAHGLLWWGYHWLTTESPSAQAQYYLQHGGAGVPCMTDCEYQNQTGSKPQVSHITGFHDSLEASGVKNRQLYLPQWYWRDYMGSPSLSPVASRGMHLVSSNYVTYTDNSSGAGWQPYGGMYPEMWQYTSSMSTGGLANVDCNAFRGSRAGDQSAEAIATLRSELWSLITGGDMALTDADAELIWGTLIHNNITGTDVPASVFITSLNSVTQHTRDELAALSAKVDVLQQSIPLIADLVAAIVAAIPAGSIDKAVVEAGVKAAFAAAFPPGA